MEVTLSGRRVFRATIELRATGVSWLEARVDGSAAMSGKVTLVAPGLTFEGTVDSTSSGVYQEQISVRVFAGANGIGTSVNPLHYRGPSGVPISVPLEDLLKISGETLHADASTSVTARVLQSWQRPAGTVGSALTDLIGTQGGGSWRIAEDGKLWCGTLAYADQNFTHQLLDHDPVHRKFVIASDKLTARPGRTFRGQKITEVRYEIDAGKTRAHITYGESATAAFVAAVGRIVDHKIDATKFYAATVLGQNADGTLELRPDDADKIAPLSKVPIRYGIPGVTAEVSKGARVRVSFDNGDREKPIASLWEPDNSTLVKIVLAGGTANVARVGDRVDCGTVTAAAGATAVTFTWTPPGGGAPVVSPTLDITALIESGAAKVKA